MDANASQPADLELKVRTGTQDQVFRTQPSTTTTTTIGAESNNRGQKSASVSPRKRRSRSSSFSKQRTANPFSRVSSYFDPTYTFLTCSDRCRCFAQSLLLPLDLIIYPCLRCFDLKCWDKRSYFKLDFSIQMYMILQTCIAIQWDLMYTTTLNVFDADDTTTVVVSSLLYSLTMYMCSIVLLSIAKQKQMMQMENSMENSVLKPIITMFRKQQTFIVTIFVYVSAFGFKYMMLAILDTYFSSSVGLVAAFLFIHLFCGLLFLSVVSFLRERCCKSLS